MSAPAAKVFVSYSKPDRHFAEALVEHLEAREVKCWIAPRDVPLGGNYAEEILKAIEVSKILVVLYSEHASLSKHVYREVERAIKHDVIIAPVRTDRSNVTGPLSYFLATTQ